MRKLILLLFTTLSLSYFSQKNQVAFSGELLYNIEKLYAKSIEEGALTNYHPRLVALKNGLTNHRETKNDVPVCEIHLQLPISVLTAENTISRQGVRVKETGAFLLITELTAYETLYNQEKKTIVFVYFIV